jgi:putative hydrolase of the HAD superfamily
MFSDNNNITRTEKGSSVMFNHKAYVFDLDDTLYCEHDYVISGFHSVASFLIEKYPTLHDNNLAEQFIDEWKRNGRGRVFNNVCDKYGVKIDIKELVDVYRNHIPAIRLYEDAVLFLNKLTGNNIPIGIITDGNSTMQWNKLRALELEKRINCIIVTDDLGGSQFWKPHPLAFQKISECLNVGTKDCVYIGDNPNKDFITAKNLGLHTIRVIREIGDHMQTVLDKEYEADRKVTSLLEIF